MPAGTIAGTGLPSCRWRPAQGDGEGGGGGGGRDGDGEVGVGDRNGHQHAAWDHPRPRPRPDFTQPGPAIGLDSSLCCARFIRLFLLCMKRAQRGAGQVGQVGWTVASRDNRLPPNVRARKHDDGISLAHHALSLNPFFRSRRWKRTYLPPRSLVLATCRGPNSSALLPTGIPSVFRLPARGTHRHQQHLRHGVRRQLSDAGGAGE
jgi:hypothetical protein